MQLVKRTACWPYHQAKAICRRTRESARHTRGQFTTENFKELVRGLFLSISKVFKGLGIAAAFPFFTAQHIAAMPARRPTKYTIGNENGAINEEDFLKTLQKLEKPARKIERLELLHPRDMSLDYSEEAVKSLRNLLPEEIVVKNGTLPDDVLDKLETFTRYYSYDADSNTYSLKGKVIHLVLPRDMDDALEMVDEMAERCEKAVNVYFYRTPGRTDELKEALKPLGYKSLMEVYIAPYEANALLPLLKLQQS